MRDLHEQLLEAEARVALIKRSLAAAPCIEVGHRWKFLGGRNVGCEEMGKDCSCSTSVHECEACGDCDYGDTPEQAEVIARCKEFGCGN